MNPLRLFFKWFFKDALKTRWSSLIFVRLVTSKHLNDLQIIATIAVAVLAAAILFAASLVDYRDLKNTDSDLIEGVKISLAFAAAAAATLNWAYQSGSRRLGGIDLFACEISVICRVCLIVDFAIDSMNRLEGEPRKIGPANAQKFTSEENYTPVYDNHLSELEPLDAETVTSVTEFYTYRKTMVDCMRAMAETPDDNRHVTNKMIYMQFLMYESARRAVEELVEYEPDRAESLAVILCSELVLYGHLLKQYQGDFRRERLDLRWEKYRKTVEGLLKEIRGNASDPDWEQIETTAGELERRWKRLQEGEPLSLAA